LAAHVVVAQTDAEPLVYAREVLLRDLDELPPERERARVAGLQQHDALARAVRELRIAVELSARRAIEIAELSHARLRAGLADVEHVLDQHAERSAPVADVVLANHLVARELEQPRERVADDRRAHVSDVHLLRDVRRRVIDDDAILDPRGRHAEPLVARELGEAALDERRLQGQIDEPRTGDLDTLADVGEIGRGDDGLRDLPRSTLQRLGHAHREIGLKIRALGAAHHRIDPRVLGAESFGHGRLQPRAENGARIARGGHGLGLSGQMWSKAGTAIPRIRGCVVYGAGVPIDPEREGSSMSFIEAHLRLTLGGTTCRSGGWPSPWDSRR